MNKTNVKIGLAVVAVIVLIGWIYVSMGSWTYSEGERVGVITKFSRKGMFLKTWEGELNMGGFDQGVASVWEFSVLDPKVVEKLHSAQRSNGRWALSYREQNWVQGWKGKTAYFIVDVQSTSQSNE